MKGDAPSFLPVIASKKKEKKKGGFLRSAAAALILVLIASLNEEPPTDNQGGRTEVTCSHLLMSRPPVMTPQREKWATIKKIKASTSETCAAKRKKIK